MSLARERRKSEVLLFAAADILEILKNVTDSVPFLSIATGIALQIVEKLTSVNDNKDRCRSTAERIVHVFLTIVETFRDADPIHPNTVPPQTTRNVEQLQHRLNGILGCVEKITRRRKVTRFLMARTITAELEDLNVQLDDCLRLFQISSLASIQYLMERHIGQLAEDATVIPRKELGLHDSYEVYSGPKYSICTGTRGGEVVAVKSFVGPHAKERWQQSVTHDLKLAIHSNVATLIGTSGASDPNPYNVYGNISGCLEQQLAFSLGSGLQESVEACIRMIYGIAAGLLYLDSMGIPVTKIGIHNIHVFSGNNSRAVLAIDWADEELPEDIDNSLLSRPIDVLDALNIRIFQEANHILHGQSSDWFSQRSPSETSEELESVSAGHRRHPNFHRHRAVGRAPLVNQCPKGDLSARISNNNARLSLSDVYQGSETFRRPPAREIILGLTLVGIPAVPTSLPR
ncbi:hypothetical protein BDZ89DRAFT_1172825 [Hymenopellis radicata]|nr:hypothetical protein BDZ89DRAFT_1172825 [Hymenopellis radicata]